MQLPQIRLQSAAARIGLNIVKPVQELQQPKAIQSIEQPKAVMEITTKKGKLNIDQSQARAEMDLKNISQRIAEFASEGMSASLQGTARRAQEGDELMRIENGGSPIPFQAKENGKRPEKQFNIGWIPSFGSVKLNYIPAEVNINVEPQKPRIDAEIQKPIHNYQPGVVNIELLQENSLDIDFINLFPEKNK